MADRIPTRSRGMVKAGQEGRCLTCGGEAIHYHHRRSRSVRDEHTHCPCNGIYLCLRCHADVTEHRLEVWESGLCVSRHVSEPARVPVSTPYAGTVRKDCTGRLHRVNEKGDEHG